MPTPLSPSALSLLVQECLVSMKWVTCNPSGTHKNPLPLLHFLAKNNETQIGGITVLCNWQMENVLQKSLKLF